MVKAILSISSYNNIVIKNNNYYKGPWGFKFFFDNFWISYSHVHYQEMTTSETFSVTALFYICTKHVTLNCFLSASITENCPTLKKKHKSMFPKIIQHVSPCDADVITAVRNMFAKSAIRIDKWTTVHDKIFAQNLDANIWIFFGIWAPINHAGAEV